MRKSGMAWIAATSLAAGCTAAAEPAPVQLITLDPGHFHAALVQKNMYPGVDPIVHVFAPNGPELCEHLKRIGSYNTRPDTPTAWDERVYTGPDFLERMLANRPGNVVVLSGNNARKPAYIFKAIDVGLNVLADKPMAITPEHFELLKQSFARAADRKVLLYDIMTERYEITTMLQKEFSRIPEVFGELEKGSPQEPAVTKESVHHFFKYVSGKPLTRPAWFFDVTQQGEGMVDVTTHLVDLIQWECFPEVPLDGPKDVRVLTARRWATALTPEQFKKATQLGTYPESLRSEVGADNSLKVFSNGEFTYTLKGVHAKVSVAWSFEAPTGAGDTHYSMMRGTRACLVIRQGAGQHYKPTLYIEPRPGTDIASWKKALDGAITKVSATYPGVALQNDDEAWQVMIPEKYNVGHEAHFAQVTEKYLHFLSDGKLPAWEVPNMLAKYYTIMQAYKLSRGPVQQKQPGLSARREEAR